jgi:hypothetical protein
MDCEAVFPLGQNLREPLLLVFDQPKEGLIMWLGLIVSLVFTYPIIEVIEEWRIRRSSEKDLREMRKHVSAGH